MSTFFDQMTGTGVGSLIAAGLNLPGDDKKPKVYSKDLQKVMEKHSDLYVLPTQPDT
jgi:patatin-like phospholipase/acyl hydrolase